MEIKNKKGFITIYVLISMIFLITIITIVLMMASRKLNNQSEINSSMYKMYNEENLSDLVVNDITEIPVYTKEQFEHMQNFIANGFSSNAPQIQYININGVAYKLDNGKRNKYKISLQTDLYYSLLELLINIEDKVILNEYEMHITGLEEKYTLENLEVSTYYYKVYECEIDTDTDENGNLIYKTDENGNLIYKTDENGNLIYKTDENRNLIYRTATSIEPGRQTYEFGDANQLNKEIYLTTKNDEGNIYTTKIITLNRTYDDTTSTENMKVIEKKVYEVFKKETNGKITTTTRYKLKNIEGNTDLEYEYEKIIIEELDGINKYKITTTTGSVTISEKNIIGGITEEEAIELKAENVQSSSDKITEIRKLYKNFAEYDHASIFISSTPTNLSTKHEVAEKTVENKSAEITIPKGFVLVDTSTTTEKVITIENYDELSGQSRIDAVKAAYDSYIQGNISNGIVVRDTSYNEFVWIPVNNINDMVMCTATYEDKRKETVCSIEKENGELKCTKHSSTSNKLTGKLYHSDDIFYVISNGSIIQTKPKVEFSKTDQYYSGGIFRENVKEYQEEFNEMANNVEEYNGFYVGRYETGGFYNSNKVKVRSGENKESLTNNDWNGMYEMQSEFGKTFGESSVWKGFYEKKYTDIEKENSKIIGSSMIWGCQYDQILKFINLKEYKISNNEKDNITGYYNVNKENMTRHYEKISTTGHNITDKVANIYDLGGNAWERTLEIFYTSAHNILRGGYANSTKFSVASRRGTSSKEVNSSIGSRMTLYIKEESE